MVKYTEAMVGSEISSENFQYFVNSTLYRIDFYTVNIQAKIKQKSDPEKLKSLKIGMTKKNQQIKKIIKTKNRNKESKQRIETKSRNKESKQTIKTNNRNKESKQRIKTKN